MNKNLFLIKKFFENSKNNIINSYNLDTINNILCEKINIYRENKDINLIVNYYKDKNDDRSLEIDLALKLNCQNQLFNKIIIINETSNDINFIEKSDKIIIINNSNRLTFKDIFYISNKYTLDNTINILINSDIVIGENFDLINLDYGKNFMVLSRYNILEDGTINFCNDSGSFDTWIWYGKINHNVGNFFMGKPFCDVLLSYELSKFYLLKNPSLDLKTYHIHNINVRNYDISQKLNGKYLKVKISTLNDKTNYEKNYIYF